MDKKYIRFIDSQYNTLFYVKSGGEIQIQNPDGGSDNYKCEYIDEYHARIGNSIYHICEFAELMEKNNKTYAPAGEIGDLEFYQKKYFDRNNVDSDGNPVPYYVLQTIQNNKNTSKQKDEMYAVCFSPLTEDKAYCKWTFYPHTKFEGVEYKVNFAKDIYDLCKDEELSDRMMNMVEAILTENPELSSVSLSKDTYRNANIFVTLDELEKELVNATAIEYKGVIFDEWTVDKENGSVWGEICQCCVDKYKDIFDKELDSNAAIGVCSVKGCNDFASDTDSVHYYIDFNPELIKIAETREVARVDRRKEVLDEIISSAESEKNKSVSAPKEVIRRDNPLL